MKQDGFTAVELLITLIIAATFVIAFFQVFVSIKTGNEKVVLRNRASNVAETLLKDYERQKDDTSWFTCNASSDTLTNPAAPGQPLNSSTGDFVGTVRAFAPRGCGIGLPIQTSVSITYQYSAGTDEQPITRSLYVGLQQ